MFKVRNRLLIAVVLFAVAFCACLNGEAEARTQLRPGSDSSYRQLKPGARVTAGEPDVGDNGKNSPPNAGNSGGSGAPVSPAPTGFHWIIPAWAARYLGVDW
jgi:hypothetical protein